jgi:hypothetical protein
VSQEFQKRLQERQGIHLLIEVEEHLQTWLNPAKRQTISRMRLWGVCRIRRERVGKLFQEF